MIDPHDSLPHNRKVNFSMNDVSRNDGKDPYKGPGGAMPDEKSQRGEAPRFISGSILRHILSMTGFGAIGLMALFIGDLANRLFLGQLGDERILAAIGYGGSILFFATSVGIGLSIAATAVVAPAIGARDMAAARRLSASAHVFAFAASIAVVAVVWPFIPFLLGAMGAHGETQAFAAHYLRILLPSMPFLAVAMCAGAVLRSVGDAKRGTNTTLVGAVVNIVLDPLLIFGLHLGLTGAAYASFLARIAMCVVGLWGVIKIHRLIDRPSWASVRRDTSRIGVIAVPAVLTNIATPISNAYTTSAISTFGDASIAAWAAYGALTPVAFGAIFALSGAIGPIIGQNLGAGLLDRVSDTVTQAIKVTVGFTFAAWLLLGLTAPTMAKAFGLTGDAAALVIFACRWLSPLFAFLGALFVANAVLNTLGHAQYATWLNWGRATIGTVPLVILGGRWGGASGVFAGNLLGAAFFGLAGIWLVRRILRARMAQVPLVN
jgi:putative MATE family efflux protein